MKYLKLKVYKKKALKITSQLVILRAFFIRPPNPKSENKNPVNQLVDKKNPVLKQNSIKCGLYTVVL